MYPTEQQPEDIYALLSADDILDVDENTAIDTNALVMSIFDTPLVTPQNFDIHPLSQPNVNSTTTSSTLSSAELNKFNQDFSNADIMSNNSNQIQYNLQANQQIQPNNTQTPNERLFAPESKEDPLFPSFNPFGTSSTLGDRRHSIAVSGGIETMDHRLFQNFQSTQPAINLVSRRRSVTDDPKLQTMQTYVNGQQQSMFMPYDQSLFTVMENETPVHMAHRASMPNLFLNSNIPPFNNRVNSISAKTSPRNTPPPPIQLNPGTNYSLSTALPPTEEPGRKRLYSQQSKDPYLCPLPMSGVSSRKQSLTTPQDISAWNRATAKKPKLQHAGDLPTVTEVAKVKGYPVISEADEAAAAKDPTIVPREQKLRFDGDEYTPQWVRFVGQLKEGYCDTCKPGKWLQLKNSAFWYHKQFFHGISSVSGKPFESPLEQRGGEHDIIEGLCHQCKEYVPICNAKRKNSVLWYRHAHKCHIYDKPKSTRTLNNDKRTSRDQQAT